MKTLGTRGIIRGALTLFASHGTARFLRYLLTVVIAAKFGMNEETDAYYIAQTFTLLFLTLNDSVFNYTLIPVLARYRAEGGEEEAQRLGGSAIIFINLIFFGVGILLFGLAEPLAAIAAPNLSEGGRDLVALLIRIIAPMPLLAGLGGVPACIFYSYRRFTLPSVTFLFYGISSIVSALLFHELIGIECIPMGALFGVFLQALVLITVLVVERRISVARKPHPGLKQMFKLTGPGLLGVLIASGNQMVDKLLATSFGPGAVTALSLAYRLNQLPYALLIAPMGSAMPHLSELAAQKDWAAMRTFVSRVIGLMAFLIIPTMVILMMLRVPLLGALIEYGKMEEKDTLVTAQAFFFYNVGTLFLALIGFARAIFFALGDPKVPLMASILAGVLNVVFDLVLMQWMGLNGIALATPAFALVICTLLIVMLQKRIGVLDWGSMLTRSILPILAASAAAGAGIQLVVTYGSEIFGPGQVGRVLLVLAGIAAGAGVYLACCFLFRVRETKEIAFLISQKLAKRRGRKESDRGEAGTGAGGPADTAGHRTE